MDIVKRIMWIWLLVKKKKVVIGCLAYYQVGNGSNARYACSVANERKTFKAQDGPLI